MTITTGLFTSDSAEWTTPREIFDMANARWGPFDLDAAATQDNALCENWIGKNMDALKIPWTGRVWLNPPYGREIGAFVRHASLQVFYENAQRVVCLLPARTDTAWWHDYVTYASEIHFLRGRLKFGGGNGSRNSAPFPSAIVVFEQDVARAFRRS